MLESLTVKNIAVADFLQCEFRDGMNCLTGETGAGKSIIIESVCFLLGDKMTKEVIRTGASEAQVTGVFSVEDGQRERVGALLEDIGVEPEDDGTVIVYRSCSDTGRSSCRINDRIVTVSALKRLGELMVDVHGQHENHSLLTPANHIKLLDSFAGAGLTGRLSVYREKLRELRDLRKTIDEMNVDPMKRAQMIDLLSFQVQEISGAKLKPGEDEELERRQKMIDNAEKISASLHEAMELLDGGEQGYGNEQGAIASIDGVIGKLASLEKYSPKYSDCLSKLRDAYYTLEDVRDTVESALDDDVFDEKEAREIESRLDLIYDLKRKYGNSVDKIIAFGEEADEKLKKLLSSEETAKELLLKEKKSLDALKSIAIELHQMRSKAAEVLEKGVVRALADMEMTKVRFRVDIGLDDSAEPSFREDGLDKVEFLISTNPGDSLRPLAKIASGGEMSRIMLAIKSCLADVDMIPVLVFDEIDTGISGSAAAAVAEKFFAVSRKHQLICVTHLAPIAAISDCNIFVGKEVEDEYVRTEAEILDEEGKIREVGRLLDGSSQDSSVTRIHSMELIERMRNRAYKINKAD